MKETIRAVATMAEGSIAQAYYPNLGFFSAVSGPYSREIWTRDAALATTGINDERMWTTFRTIMDSQRTDGTLPRRIELKHHTLAYIFGWLSRYHLDLVSHPFPHAVYENSANGVPERDTLPATIIAFTKLLHDLEDRREAEKLLQTYFPKLELALDRESIRVDPCDQLISGDPLQDWLDCIKRPGKLAFINILFFQAYRQMAYLASQLRDKQRFVHYRSRSETIRESILATFWNEKGYLQAGPTDQRLDTAANIFACLFGLSTTNSLTILESIENKARMPHGLLKTVDQPYPISQVSWRTKAFGLTKYGHVFLYPWLAHLNILTKLEVARSLDAPKRHELELSSLNNFLAISQLHEAHQGFYEMLDEETFQPVVHRIAGLPVFRSGYGFLGSASTYLAALNRLKSLGLV